MYIYFILLNVYLRSFIFFINSNNIWHWRLPLQGILNELVVAGLFYLVIGLLWIIIKRKRIRKLFLFLFSVLWIVINYINFQYASTFNSLVPISWFSELNNITSLGNINDILIQNTVPLSHFDLEENKSLLLENNFENLNSISWDKGCYVGQELTARMKYRALLKKRIYSLTVKEGTPQIEQAIKDDENNYGKIINLENNSILAMLKIKLAESKINEQQEIKTNDGLVLEFII